MSFRTNDAIACLNMLQLSFAVNRFDLFRPALMLPTKSQNELSKQSNINFFVRLFKEKDR